MFCWLLFFVGITFHTKNKSTAKSLLTNEIANQLPPSHPPKSTMISPVVTITKEMMDKKFIKMKIGVGSVVKAKVREIEDNTKEGRIWSMSKEVVGCVQAVVANKTFLV